MLELIYVLLVIIILIVILKKVSDKTIKVFLIIVLLVPIIPIILLIGFFKNEFYKNEFLTKIERKTQYKIEMNGCNLNSGLILEKLKEVKYYSQHHSGYSKKIKLEIKDQNEEIIVFVAQDAYIEELSELWIFYKNHEIGRIRDKELVNELYYGICMKEIKYIEN